MRKNMATILKFVYVIMLFIYSLFVIESFGHRFLIYNNCKNDTECPNDCGPHEQAKCILYACYCVE